MERHLRTARDGDGDGIHQARVASRRLREAVPVLATGISNARQGKIRKKIRRITRALGSIRELDVTISLIDELARREAVPRLALEHVRAAVLREHARHAGTMAKRLEKIKIDRLDRRLVALAAGLEESTSHEWRNSLAHIQRRADSVQEAFSQWR